MAVDPSDGDDADPLGPPEYLAYRVLSEHHEQFGGELSRTQYFKLTTLTDAYLQRERDIDVGLPAYWYFYGRTVRESAFTEQVAFSPEANHKAGRAYYPADRISPSDFTHVDARLKDEIFSAARHVVEKHGAKTATELEELQYRDHAPNDFVQAYGTLRGKLEARTKTNDEQSFLDSFLGDEPHTEIHDSLDEMLTTFPDEYEALSDEYLLWDDTFRLLVEQDESYRTLREFLEELIEAVSIVYLRFEDNQHITPETLEEWEHEAERKPDEFRTVVEERRSAAMETRERSGYLDDVSESYNETILDEIRGPETETDD